MLSSIKKAVRGILAQFGYVVRSVGHRSTLTGVDLFHDARALLGGKSDAVLFDVGANVGQTVQEFLATFHNPRILSFEPSPATFETLRAKYGGRSGICLENIALGDNDGTLPFHVTRGQSVNDSLLRPTWEPEAKEVPVRVETLDGYCERHGIEAIDLLKIDTQGNDLNVLRGAKRLLHERRIRLFSVEVLCTAMYDGQPGLVEIASFAEQASYRLVGFYELTYNANRLWYLNACFERGDS